MQGFINFFGQMIKKENVFYLAAGNRKVSFVDVRDIAALAMELLTKNNGTQHENKAYGITARKHYRILKQQKSFPKRSA
jgi:uncharacterized protein YbjT (DUF2867 family)